MNSVHTANKLRFRTHFSLVKGQAVSKKDSTVVRLNDGKWLCVRRNGETGRFKTYERIEDWMSELPRNDGVICLTDEATRVERMKPGEGVKRVAKEEPKPITDKQIGENIMNMIAMANTCITTSGRVRCITELMRYLVSVPNYVRNNPEFHKIIKNKCNEYMESDEFMENTDLHHAVYQAYTTFA
jgi:hypothetical protein